MSGIPQPRFIWIIWAFFGIVGIAIMVLLLAAGGYLVIADIVQYYQ